MVSARNPVNYVGGCIETYYWDLLDKQNPE